MLSKDEVIRAGKFIVKWGGSNYTGADANNKQTPGWMLETQEDRFLTRLDEDTSLMKDATFIRMEARQHALDYLFVRPTLQPMSTSGGMLNTDLDQLTETIPKFARRELDARPYVAYTYTPKQFIWENIEKDEFLEQYEALLAEACGVAAESLCVYADKTAGDSIDGLFKQLDTIAAETDEEIIRENGKGYYGQIDRTPSTGSLVGQIMDMITSFADQNGNIGNAVLYTSTMLRGAILKEAANRETELGDAIYLNGNDISIFGIPVKTASFLSRPASGFSERIILCDPASVVFGFVSELESESTYEHNKKAYLSSVDVELDVGMIYPTDVLYAEIVDGAVFGKVKNTTQSSVTLADGPTSASITVAAGATVDVPVGTYKNGAASVKVEKGKTTTISA